MSRKDMKSYNNYRESLYKFENEPEEGEIVDDYDLIVSSDEELSMRQRIRELEAENEEIEQIAVISRSYVDKINPPRNRLVNSRAAQVPTDVSSISSTEFVTPKKRKRRKSREYKKKHCHHQHQHQHNHNQYQQQHTRYEQQPEIPLRTRSKKTHCKRRQKLFAKKHHKIHSDRYTYKEINAESVSLETSDSSDSSSFTDTDNYGKNLLSINSKKDDAFNYGKYITRDTLRMAVARTSNESVFSSKKSCLKDKLLRQELVGQSTNTAIGNRLLVGENDEFRHNNDGEDDDDDVQVIENEPDIHTIDEDSTDSMEEKELRLIALKSAVLKKHMARKMRNAEAAYSPTDFDEMLSSGILRQDNKMDDLDVVDLEAEDSQNVCATVSPIASPQLMMLDDQDESQQMVDCKPVDMDIANSDSEDTAIGSWSKEVEPALPKLSLVPHDFANNFQYGYYMPELHELPPPPPGVDDYENAPPPLTYHKIYNAEMQDMELDIGELTEDQHWQDSKQAVSKNASSSSAKACHKEVVEDEEEEALRALLLSKFQTPKNQKKTKKANYNSDTLKITELAEEFNNKPQKPTEIILKEAVKRLKIHSQTELYKAEPSTDFNKQNSCTLSTTEPHESTENNSESLTLLQKLRYRLNKYKCQHKTLEESNENVVERKPVITEHLKDTPVKSDNICNVAQNLEQPTICPNTLEVTNKIDISDITRRLQQIKENVLNSTNKQTHQEPLTNLDSYEISPQSNESFNVNENQLPLENVTRHQNQFNNSLYDNGSASSESNISLLNEKTVEANFDVSTNQTTFKVTINNSAAIQTEDKHIKQPVKDASFKENQANNVTKNIKLKDDLALNSERSVKAINKKSASSAEIKTQLVKPIMSNAQITVAPTTYSLLRATKIVKPNKVINTNFDLNRRPIPQTTEFLAPPKPTGPDDSSNLANTEDNTRLITSMEKVKHMCKVAPFVISVQNSSNESSGDEWGGNYNSLYKPLCDYNDNASPLSLNMESPSRTPLRSNSPTEPGIDESTKSAEFDIKLDAFLKNARTSLRSETAQSNGLNLGEKMNKTPLAVRHLPAAAQSEYRRLVHRMKLLENKRKSAQIDENKKDCNASKKNDCILPATEDLNKEKDKADSTPKTSLVKKVLIRNANNNTTTNELQIANGSSTSQKCHKSNVLRCYENVYVKFGAGIVNNLDKSLKLVEEAKKAKITKLKLENRLKELKAEMDILQSKHKEEQLKIARIYPSICTTNDVITSLKQKRSKVFKAALNLGKTLKGDDYRLNNDLKESITAKSKQLATEIKIVNSLKAQDLSKIEEAVKTSNTKELIDVKMKKKKTEDFKTESNSGNIETKLNVNKTVVSSESSQEKEAANNFEILLQPDVGGNTEFQNFKSNKSNNSQSTAKSMDTCSTEVDTTSKNIDAKKDSKQSLALPSYISPLEHLRNIDSNVDPNGVICPYDLMGNCEDITCKYIHITP